MQVERSPHNGIQILQVLVDFVQRKPYMHIQIQSETPKKNHYMLVISIIIIVVGFFLIRNPGRNYSDIFTASPIPSHPIYLIP